MGKIAQMAMAAVAAISLDAAGARLASYNVMHCEGSDRRIDIERTAAAIIREKTDYVGLQELDRSTGRSGGVDQPAELARLCGMEHVFAKAIDFSGGGYGVGVLSREKPLSTFTTPLPGKEPRILLLCEYRDFWFGTTHLSVAAEDERVKSIEIIRKAVGERAAKKPVFLTGDWNSTPDSTVLAGMREFMTVMSREDSRTWHGFKPPKEGEGAGKAIDYIAVDKAHAAAFRASGAAISQDVVTSDHFPISVTVSAVGGGAPK